MEWIAEPSAWMGLLTLVVLEVVLGVDNLVFIAILADKVHPKLRDRARIIGLTLALLMRLFLLTVMVHLMALTQPLFALWGHGLSGRNIILMLGGAFLLWKATMELHERLEGVDHSGAVRRGYASFGLVLLQIVVLDMVFSLDAIITAVGMVEHLPVMMLAVVIAMGLMIWASRPLTHFVNAHPTVVMLCLSFLLLIGFSLVVEGIGFQMPKGYLYAAIGFSIMIEFFNQMRERNLLRTESRLPLRERQARRILRLLGERPESAPGQMPPSAQEDGDAASEALQPFEQAERHMVSGVLSLGERSVLSIMTPRAQVVWLNIGQDLATLQRQVMQAPHSMFPVCERDDLDTVIGIGRAKEILADLMCHQAIDREKTLRPPLIVPESISIIRLTEMLRQSRGHMALVSDEYGAIQGLLTPMDVLEAIAGEFPDVGEDPEIHQVAPGHWTISGLTDVHTLEQATGVRRLGGDDDDYSTVAGLMLHHLKRLPEPGQVVHLSGLRLEVLEVQQRRITSVDARRVGAAGEEDGGNAASAPGGDDLLK